MATQGNDGFWPRMLFTSFILIWMSVAVGAMLGNTAVEKYLADDTVSAESSMPTKNQRVWIDKAEDKQAEIDRSNNKNSELSQEEDAALVAAPIEEKAQNEVKQFSVTPSETPSVTAGGSNSVDSNSGPSESETPSENSLASSSEGREKAASAESSGNIDGRVLFFGTFMQKETVDTLGAKLEQVGVPYLVQEIAVESGTAYKITSTPYASVEEANAELEALKNSGIQAYVNE
ncbi:MAG: SPOR domain-containing protein [Candidatus Bruticola sp.]